MLNQLWPTAGRDLIVHKESGYTWSEAVPMELDFEEFDELCGQHPEDEDQQLELCLKAIALYRGDFLEKQSSENWVIPITAHFHNLYVEKVVEASFLLSRQMRHQEAVDICRKAVVAEPYHEQLHQILMQELGAMGDQKGASDVYEALSKRLFDDFGIRPSDQTREVYRKAAHSVSEKILPMDEVLEQVTERESASGAMFCDYDHFKVLCFAESRAMERNGTVTHIVLMSLAEDAEKPLTKRSQSRIMDQLGEQIRTNLRRGDTFSRCSVTQYILMLPKANYENSCMVCRRIIAAFGRQYPHSPACIDYAVQPLEPNI
jgi:DNA-binding SARP family transcriptional activator